MKLRVATYNIHKGVSTFGLRNRLHDMKLALAGIAADLLFLQEVQDVNLRAKRRFANWPDEPQTRFLAGADYHVAYGGNARYDHGHHGNAILARRPFVHSSNTDISDHPFEKRGMLHAVQCVESVDVHCVNVHLSLFAGSRRRQIDAIVAGIREVVPDHAPLILAGDFNDWNERLGGDLLHRLGTRDAAAARTAAGGRPGATARALRTFPSMLPWFGLDRIYTRGFAVASCDVMRGRVWSRLSDHAPLVADLVLDSDA